jgi:SGNH domain (fused to AT3 domains)
LGGLAAHSRRRSYNRRWPQAILNRLVLANKASVWIGLISYPLYLWHWPLLSLAWIIEARDPPRNVRFGIIFISIALAWLTYRFIERPIRKRPSNNLVPSLAFVVALLGIVSLVVCVMQPDWLPNQYNRVIVAEGDVGSPPFLAYYNEHFFPCATGDRDLDSSTGRCIRSHSNRPIELAIVGDSHAQHIFPGLAEALPNANVAYMGIVDFLGPTSKLPSIQNAQYASIFRYIRTQPSIKSVVISAYWYARLHHDEIPEGDSLEDEMRITATALTAQGKRVFLAGDVPFFDLTAAGCKYVRVFGPKNACEQDRGHFYREYQNWFPDLLSVSNKNTNVEALDFARVFCWDEFCHMVKGDVPLHRDSSHLNILGSRLLGEVIAAEHPHMIEKVQPECGSENNHALRPCL